MTFDVAVVGLGATGSAAVYQLAKRGARVLGIDRHSPPHALGSSHGDSRITRLAIGEGAQYTPLVRRSHEIWREIEAETGADLLAITGGLIISSPARKAETHVANFFENTIAAAKRFGIEHERLDADAIRARFPQFNVADNELGYYEPGAGLVRPEACIEAQLHLAERHGAVLHGNERVRELSEDGEIVRVATDRGRYDARRVILSAGPWLPELVDPGIARLFTVSRQVIYWFDVSARAGDFVPERFPVWIWELQDRRHVIYGLPAIDGPAGGAKVATEQYDEATTPESAQRDVSPAEIRAMHRDLVAPYLPGVGEKCVKAAACLYTITPDFHFVIDRHPRMPRVVIASPCSGHGFKHSAAIGETLAQLVLDGSSKLDLRFFALQRFNSR